MKKKEKEKNFIKNSKKEQKLKDPKDYIPPQLLSNLRDYVLINKDSNNNTEEIEENKNNQNYSSNYKPEFIPCKIAEVWNYNSINEINDEIFQGQEIISDIDKENSLKEEDNNENKENNNKQREIHESNKGYIRKLNKIIKLDDDSDMFSDPDVQTIKDNLPLYVVDILNNEFIWKRPYQYVLKYYLWEKVKLIYPKKKQSVICNEIIQTYKEYLIKIINGEISQDEEEKNLNNYLSNETETIKTRIYKEFYPIIDKDYNIKVCDYISRLETDEEYEVRKEKESKEKKDNKGNKENKKEKEMKKKKITKNLISDKDKDKVGLNDKKVIKTLKISNLKLNTNLNSFNSFYTWITSIYQFIIDNNINDLNTKKSILYNIYPQKDGIPIYNPKGKYIIKLYLMGKERKIIIDDKIPFTNDDEFVFPGCEKVEEIWPILFTKALFKLNIYKHRHPNFYKQEEFTDISIIYNLTGKFVALYDLNDERIINFLTRQYNELIPENNNEYIFGFLKSTKTKSMKIAQLYQTYEERIGELNNRIINKEKSKHLIPLMNSIKAVPFKNKLVHKVKFKEEFNLDSSHKKRIIFKLDNDHNTERRDRTRLNNKRFGTIKVKENNSIINNIKKQSEQLKQNGFLKNYLYSLTDFFLSKNFNLKRTKKLNFDDLKKEDEDSKLEFKQLNINMKKEYTNKRKEIKKRHQEERINRINELKEIKENEYVLYKLNSNSINLPTDFESFDLYNDKELSMARKCIANGWVYPPMEFFTFDDLPMMDSNLSKKNQIKVLEFKKNKKNILLYGFTLLNYKELTGENYFEEKNMEKNKILNTRDSSKKGGFWFEENIIQNNFDQVIIVFNGESLYNNMIICDNSYEDYLTDTYEPKDEYQAFYFSFDNIQDKETNIVKNKEIYLINNSDNKPTNYNIDIIFEPYIEQLYKQKQPKVYLMPNINIDIFECDTQNEIFQKITLNKFYSFFHSDFFESSKNYYMAISNDYVPMGYNLIVISNGFKIQNMTRNKIYQQILNYKEQVINIDFPSLEQNKIWLFGKILIKNKNKSKDNSNLKFKLNINFPIKQIFPFIHVYLENESINSKRREIMLNEFVTIKSKGENNYITITIKPEYTLKGGNIKIEIIYDNEDYNFELIDTSQPYEIAGLPAETYNNGLIFNEYIYPSENEVVSFINLDIINEDKDNELFNECNFTLELYQLTIEPNINFEINPIHFSYSNVGTLLKSETFYNSITLTNFVFYSKKIEKGEPKNDNNKTKEKGKNNKDSFSFPYILICYVNDRQNYNFKFDKIKWNIRVFSNYMISFIKDTSKISHENKIKEDWEIGHEGRKLKASETRKKYIALTKRKRGIELSQDEMEILSRPIQRKSDIDEREENIELKNIKENIDKRNNKLQKIAKINDNKANNLILNAKSMDVNNNNSNELNLGMLPFIKLNNNINTSRFRMANIINSEKKMKKSKSSYIINYVNYFKNSRLIKYENVRESSILTKSKYQFYNEKINDEFEKSETSRKKDDYFVKSKDQYKNDGDQIKFKKFINRFGKLRISANNSMKNLMTKRSNINKSLIERIKFEKTIKDIITGAVNLEINEMSSISNRAKQVLPENFKGLDELDMIIKRKKEGEKFCIKKSNEKEE